jgi:GTPase SAR1 family protein
MYKKLLVMGDGGVGKSCLVNVYVGNAFPEAYDATIYDKYRADILVDGKVRVLALFLYLFRFTILRR